MKDRHIISLVSDGLMMAVQSLLRTMLLLKVFSTASTIFLYFSRRKGATTNSSSLTPFSVHSSSSSRCLMTVHVLLLFYKNFYKLNYSDYCWIAILRIFKLIEKKRQENELVNKLIKMPHCSFCENVNRNQSVRSSSHEKSKSPKHLDTLNL